MKKYSIILLSSVIAISACVSKKKYHSEQAKVKQLQTDSVGTHSKLSDCNIKVADLEKSKAEVQRSLQELSATSQSSLEISKMTIADQAKRLKDLQTLIQSQKDILTKLKKSVSDALIGFKPDELTVELKDGRLYVSLQEKLLFKSGSAVVDPKGKEALLTLAGVLFTTQDIGIMIEGHTDNVPVSGKYEDNWALSTARSTAIVRILTNDYKVDPKLITAAGRAEFYPVEDNATVQGKARNRRTEIILSPNLKELFKLLGQ
jgi:chemotaxis protein MotB